MIVGILIKILIKEEFTRMLVTVESSEARVCMLAKTWYQVRISSDL